MNAYRIHVSGIVQGVGFRPWVWTLAQRLELGGWVRNTSSGVDVVVEGGQARLDEFVAALRAGGPPRARIDALVLTPCPPGGHHRFDILESSIEPGAFLPVSPDIATCGQCLAEMHDPQNRRWRYPFINCTNCGPRFTIVLDIPYDRPNTTMAKFEMCPRCRAEYEDPADRRFHAQPIACAACGPTLRLVCGAEAPLLGEAALQSARERLRAGEILAVKGLGGYHLACDACNPEVVARLREGKRREGKPFALMAGTCAEVARHAALSEDATALLGSSERPVVLLPRASGSALALGVAPGRDFLGFMLPYTPLHHLLLEAAPGHPAVLVMTSANLRDEPIAYRDEEAKSRLGAIADAFMLHDRAIHMRTDDSVVAEFRQRAYFFRRSRGYAPTPLTLPSPGPRVLATGGEMKNVFCLTRDGQAFLSHHIGELEHLESHRAFEEGVEHFERLFRIQPELIAHDLHPDALTTRYAIDRAERERVPAVAVQHHHAHIASCMAENGLGDEHRVIGVAFDGAGYGPDGAIWGGEWLIAGYRGYRRPLHLRYTPLPGGDAGTRRPYRMALSWLRRAGVGWAADLSPVREAHEGELTILERQLDAGINTPPTSSVGRLFDAFASIAGLCHRITYEAQAAAELEAQARAAGPVGGAYRFEIGEEDVDPAPAIRAAVEDFRRGESAGTIALRFHRGLARMVVEGCGRLRQQLGIDTVALSGGVWQNMLLLQECTSMLERDGFRVLVHHQVPSNDGGLALGQAVIASAWSRQEN